MITLGILNGPNLNRLGKRPSCHYGAQSLEVLEHSWQALAKSLGFNLITFQSNSEGALIDALHAWDDKGVEGAVVNPAGYTHSSVALRDAIESIAFPCVEVHLSHIFAREPFRQTSLIAPVCIGTISGLGPFGYEAAIYYLLGLEQKREELVQNVSEVVGVDNSNPHMHR